MANFHGTKITSEIEINKPCEFEINSWNLTDLHLLLMRCSESHSKDSSMVDPSLEDYQHLHPVPDDLFDGIWYFTLPQKHLVNTEYF